MKIMKNANKTQNIETKSKYKKNDEFSWKKYNLQKKIKKGIIIITKKIWKT